MEYSSVIQGMDVVAVSHVEIQMPGEMKEA